MKFSLALAFTLLGVASAATPQRKRSDNEAPSSRRLDDHDHDHEDETHLGIEDAMVASMSMSMSMGTEDPAEVATRSTSSATGIAVSGVVSAACALGAYAIA
mmetsp:Transcript_4835/g.10669  ORF Transcript_4835/g.10669 Transcript_4835/m.10669 type:complete len:102 (-) Transcript_4835:300-605(-)